MVRRQWCAAWQLPDGEKGLENNQGQYNCFINVVIQALWHLTGTHLTTTSIESLE